MIEIKNLSKKFKRKIIFKNLNATIKPNLFYALLGLNGAGKSSLLSMISNIIRPTDGEILLDGQKICQIENYRSKFGIVTQIPYFIEDLSVKEYFEFLIKIQNLKWETSYKYLVTLCESVDLPLQEKTLIKNLSIGNQKKVSIVGSLIHKPSFLLYDEPFANLDFRSEQSIYNLLDRQRTTSTLIMATHDINKALNFCDVFLVIINQTIISLNKNEYKDLSILKLKIEDLLNRP